MTLPLNKTVLYVRNIFISLRSRTEKPLLFQAIQFVSTKPKENEHIMTPQYWLPDSWDKGECLIAGFQTKPTQLRTRVCVKEVLKGNITHSSTATKEHWNSLQNSLFFHYSKWRGGKKSHKPIKLLCPFPIWSTTFWLCAPLCWSSMSLLQEAAPHFQDSRTVSLMWPNPAWGLCHTGQFQSHLWQKAFTTEQGP